MSVKEVLMKLEMAVKYKPPRLDIFNTLAYFKPKTTGGTNFLDTKLWQLLQLSYVLVPVIKPIKKSLF